ncbi:hypothetical protein [Frankia gtarii]|uniref:hypothetical protein n=1 Tax=Frankia gtarii TaxID=2950102 RepID=UPI0021BE0222|nr:hypothetical protein [Frankia gtarii]
MRRRGRLVAAVAPRLLAVNGVGADSAGHVQHVRRRLRQQGQQDRVPALRLPPLQRLRRQPTTHRGQEPAPLRRQHRQVEGVRVHATPSSPGEVKVKLSGLLHAER